MRTPVRRPGPAGAQHPRPAGSRHRRAHAAGGRRVPPLPPPGPRPVRAPGQAGAPAHHRRRHRTGQGPDRTHRRSAGAPGPQLDRPWPGNARCARAGRQGRDRHHHPGGLAPGRAHRHRSQRRWPRPESRTHPGQGRRTRPGRAREPHRRAGLGPDLPARLLHRRSGHRPVRTRRGHGRGPPQHPGAGR